MSNTSNEPSTTSMENEIIKIEEAIKAAQLACDVAYFEHILSDNFKFITPDGRIVSKREDIDQYRSGTLKLKRVDIQDRTIQFFDQTAIVRSRSTFEGLAGNHSFSASMFFTRVYLKQSDGWKMIAGHASDLTTR